MQTFSFRHQGALVVFKTVAAAAAAPTVTTAVVLRNILARFVASPVEVPTCSTNPWVNLQGRNTFFVGNNLTR